MCFRPCGVRYTYISASHNVTNIRLVLCLADDCDVAVVLYADDLFKCCNKCARNKQ